MNMRSKRQRTQQRSVVFLRFEAPNKNRFGHSVAEPQQISWASIGKDLKWYSVRDDVQPVLHVRAPAGELLGRGVAVAGDPPITRIHPPIYGARPPAATCIPGVMLGRHQRTSGLQ